MIVSQSVQLSSAEVVIFEQFILGDTTHFHCFPKRFKRNHGQSHSQQIRLHL
nr:MAG TPA: hypothetical protein [Caudoviricetes sp.]